MAVRAGDYEEEWKESSAKNVEVVEKWKRYEGKRDISKQGNRRGRRETYYILTVYIWKIC